MLRAMATEGNEGTTAVDRIVPSGASQAKKVVAGRTDEVRGKTVPPKPHEFVLDGTKEVSMLARRCLWEVVLTYGRTELGVGSWTQGRIQRRGPKMVGRVGW